MFLRNPNRRMLALALAASCTLPVWGQTGPMAEPGKNFLKPPPMPEAPYGLQQLDATGPLFLGQRYDGTDFLDAPAPVVSGEQAIGAETFSGDYSLSGMLQLASANNPTLRQAQLQISAQTAKALQAGLYPNPVLHYIGEQIGVDGTAGEFQGMSVQQRFVTAGKLQLSREKYMRRAHVSEHQAMVQQFRVCNDVRIHFYRTLAAWQIAAMRSELLKTAEDMAVTARELYNQGQANRPDVHRSNVALQRARLDVLQAENHYRDQFRRLTALVGVELAIAPLVGQLMPEGETLTYDEALASLMTESPELMVARTKLAADGATLRREQVEWVPDIVARGGSGYNFEAQQATALAGVSLELPLFDRNQGTIRQAQVDMIRQQSEIRRVELELQQRLANTYQQYLTSLQMATEYGRVIVPESKLAYEGLLESYKDNRVDWPEVLDAQHEYFDVRLTHIQQLEEARANEVLVRGFLLHGGLIAAEGPTPPGHIDAVPKPR